MWLRRGFSTFLQQAKELPIDSYAIAEFSKKLGAETYRDAETWNVLQRKFIRGGFPFDATKTFLGMASKVGISLLPEFHRDFENLITTGFLSRRRQLRLIRYYVFFGPSQEVLKRCFTKFTDIEFVLRAPDTIINAYASFWNTAPEDYSARLFKHIYSAECSPSVVYRCYDFAVRLGDTKRMDLIDKIAGRLKEVDYSVFIELGEKIVTVSNFAKFKEEWLAAFPTKVADFPMEEQIRLFKVLKELTPSPDTFPAIVTGLAALPATIELHEKIILAKELSELFEAIGKGYGELLWEDVKKLKEASPEEAGMCEALLAEVVPEGSN